MSKITLKNTLSSEERLQLSRLFNHNANGYKVDLANELHSSILDQKPVSKKALYFFKSILDIQDTISCLSLNDNITLPENASKDELFMGR